MLKLIYEKSSKKNLNKCDLISAIKYFFIID